MEKCIIVAVADNWAIGRKNGLLWHLTEDMKYFRKTTVGSPVIMGYMTFTSLGGKPLPKRANIVISIFPWPDAPEGITVVGSLDEAYDAAGRICDADPEGTRGKCFVIGGGYTYAEAMNSADTLYITHVHDSPADADTFFPKIDLSVFRVESVAPTITEAENGVSYNFTVYRRRTTGEADKPCRAASKLSIDTQTTD